MGRSLPSQWVRLCRLLRPEHGLVENDRSRRIGDMPVSSVSVAFAFNSGPTKSQSMDKPRPFAGIEGRRVGGDPDDEREHFYLCPACGQAVDMRKLGQVFHHEVPGHEPLDLDG